ncbi:MAG TPA: HAMP domain-containing sensor histidine kinase [Isosphaeraceae bacterium]|nr:HAMP domain-containing sensor histidine kinase [Isosphaeraceae bacterium]
MRRLGPVWLIFGLCVALASGAMYRLGATALDLERAEARARRQAALEENLQLALWRMDSALAPLMAEESARPYFSYSPLYPAERAFTRMFAEIRRGDVLVPSPLLTFSSGQVRLHFQYGPDGRLSSPQVPAGNMRDLAEARYLPPDRVENASRQLIELGRLVSRDDLAVALAGDDPTPSNNLNPALAYGPESQVQSQSQISNEYMMRSRSTKVAQNAAPAQALPLSARSSVNQGALRASWIGPALILARRVRVEEGTFLQGCWLDWDVIRNDLLAGVADLLPHASLEPVRAPAGLAPSRMLASLPVRLVPGAEADEPEPRWSPVRLSLAIAWACLALAASAVALLLLGALGLSERRGTFVSAVTHELRTPLTTFRLYTEMLDEGMVAGDEARRSYLRTLRAEADRLGHLVENVLAFARLERGRAADGREVVTPDTLLDRLIPRLTLRARQSGMELLVNPCDSTARVRVDLSVVDQILSNLVDNAVKYAGDAPDRRIHLDVAPSGRWLSLAVRDHGPGLPPRAIRRLFRPFSKSAHDAAQSAPGVGLGLALSRRLARSLGGDLRLQANGPLGACFVLTLPLA